MSHRHLADILCRIGFHGVTLYGGHGYWKCYRCFRSGYRHGLTP